MNSEARERRTEAHSGLIAAVLADDLTGAQEMGALLAAHGLRTSVMLSEGPLPPGVDAIVVDTESRHLLPEEAALRVWHAARSLAGQLPPSRVFKKIDSTLRGHVATETAAFSEAFDGIPVSLTPAYPAMGRTVANGILLIDGVPVVNTDFAHDPLAPVTQSDIRSLALDAANDEDLERIAALGTLLAGSGGLGRAWVRTLPSGNYLPTTHRASRPILICGSAHPVSRAQTTRARQLGIPVVASPEAPGDPLQLAGQLEREAAVAIRTRRPDLLILFGGETAYRVLRNSGISTLQCVREVLTGVALSMSQEMMVVTKAGGFGEPADIDRILEQLT